MNEKIYLEKKDYDFIDSFCKETKIPEGLGIKNILMVFYNEVKANLSEVKDE